jgi:hypothetical protein
MSVDARNLCTGFVLAHRSLETLSPLLGDLEPDGLPMLLLAPLPHPKIIPTPRPSALKSHTSASRRET